MRRDPARVLTPDEMAAACGSPSIGNVVLEADVQAFEVLADQHEVDVVVAAAGNQRARGAHVRVQLELLAQPHVHRAEAAADRRGERALQGEARAPDAVEQRRRQRIADLGDGGVAAFLDVPRERAMPSASRIGDHRFGDLGSDAVAGNERGRESVSGPWADASMLRAFGRRWRPEPGVGRNAGARIAAFHHSLSSPPCSAHFVHACGERRSKLAGASSKLRALARPSLTCPCRLPARRPLPRRGRPPPRASAIAAARTRRSRSRARRARRREVDGAHRPAAARDDRVHRRDAAPSLAGEEQHSRGDDDHRAACGQSAEGGVGRRGGAAPPARAGARGPHEPRSRGVRRLRRLARARSRPRRRHPGRACRACSRASAPTRSTSGCKAARSTVPARPTARRGSGSCCSSIYEDIARDAKEDFWSMFEREFRRAYATASDDRQDAGHLVPREQVLTPRSRSRRAGSSSSCAAAPTCATPC